MALFTFNEDEALAGSSVGGGFIKESGAHTGSFSEVYEVTSQGGAKGIYLSFLSDTGAQANITLYTVDKSGGEMKFNGDKIQSLLGLIGFKKGQPLRQKQNTTVKQKDWDNGGMKDVRVISYPEIENKHIGVFFEARENTYNGKTSIRPEIIIFYDAESKQTYAEKAKGLDASTLAGLIERMPSVVAAKVTETPPPIPQQNRTTEPPEFPSTPPDVSDDFDDDIPF